MDQTQISTLPVTDRLRQIQDTGRNLWLAGLGALAEIEHEGRAFFDQLVERGRPLEARRRQAVDQFGNQANAKLREVGELVRDQVRYDVKRALLRVGIPTVEDFQQLSSRLEALSLRIDETIDELAQDREAAGAAPARPTESTEPAKSTKPRAAAKKR